MLEKIIENIFPISCEFCGRIYKKWICPKCYIKIKDEFKFDFIKTKKFTIYYIGYYEKTIRKLLLKFKFKESAYLAELFSEIMSKNKEFTQKIKEYDYIIPVPMYIKNKKIRGYNQTELLAHQIEKNINIKYNTEILIKTKENRRQSELNEKERKENIKNVYDLQNSIKVKNKKILLLDDIYTTGNTISECIKVLKKANPKKIDVLVIAKKI